MTAFVLLLLRRSKQGAHMTCVLLLLLLGGTKQEGFHMTCVSLILSKN